jgi:hypothetical protein
MLDRQEERHWSGALPAMTHDPLCRVRSDISPAELGEEEEEEEE